MRVDVLLLTLLAGHFVGDFVLQSDGLVRRKTRNPWWLVVHVLIVTGLTWVFLGSVAAWSSILLVAVAHLLIDAVKARLRPAVSAVDSGSREGEDLGRAFGAFLGDQFFHVLSLVLIWFTIRHWFPATPDNYWVHLWGPQYARGLILMSGFAVGVWGIGVALQYQMAPLAKEVPASEMKGLLRGGKTIGLLERTRVLTFVLAGKPEGVAFVVAAKSVFRIGDLTDQDDRLHAEYIMIGTIRSFTYALIAAYLMKWLLALNV